MKAISIRQPWFFGPVGFQLLKSSPLPFLPLKGRLSFFENGMSIGKYGMIVPEENL